MVVRYDTAPIGKIVEDTMTGFLHVNDVPIARVGVFPYMRADGSVEMEAKLPQELLADSTIASANNRAITNDHPSELVTRENFNQYGKGITANNAHSDGKNIRVDITITDPGLIQSVKDGKEELSIGFITENAPQKGNYQGVTYDSIQRNIEINHVAVVQRGRAGHSVRLTGDSAVMTATNDKEGGDIMEGTKVILDGQNITVDDDDAKKVSTTNASMEALKKQVASLQAENKELKDKQKDDPKKSDDDSKAKQAKEEADKQKKRADQAETQLETLQARNDELEAQFAQAEHEKLVSRAKPFVGDSFDFDDKDDKAIKIAAIKAQNDGFDETGKSDDYINARFDMLEELANNSKVVGPNFGRNDGGHSLSELQNSRYTLYKGGE